MLNRITGVLIEITDSRLSPESFKLESLGMGFRSPAFPRVCPAGNIPDGSSPQKYVTTTRIRPQKA